MLNAQNAVLLCRGELYNLARQVAIGANAPDLVDDLVSAASVVILKTKGLHRPGYYAKRALWAMQDYLKREHRRSEYPAGLSPVGVKPGARRPGDLYPTVYSTRNSQEYNERLFWRRMAVRECVKSLPDEARRICNLILAGNTKTQIAGIMGLSRYQVHRRLTALRPRFKRFLNESERSQRHERGSPITR